MVVCFANQKGGVGKTTLAIAYANHLAINEKRVILLDTDYQRSCLFKRESEKDNFDEDSILYEIEHHDLDDYESGYNFMLDVRKFSEERDVIVLIDTPGSLENPYLVPIFTMSDIIVCPFVYQNFVLDSTSTFIQIIQQLKNENPHMKAQLIFVPNIVEKGFGTADEWKAFNEADNIFKEYGHITPRVYKNAELKRISTVLYYPKQMAQFKACFAFIDTFTL